MTDLPRLLPQKSEVSDEFPRVSSDLIDLLDKSYPHRCLRIEENINEHHRYAGVRDLLDQLIAWRNEELYGDDYQTVQE